VHDWRFVGVRFLQKVRTGTVLGIAALVACLLVCTSILSLGHLAMWSIHPGGVVQFSNVSQHFSPWESPNWDPLTGDGSAC